MTRIASFGVLLAVAGATACAPLVRPVENHRGFVPDEGVLDSIQPGIDTKMSVSSRLGTPTTLGNFDGETWYYIESDQVNLMYHRPRIKKQQVVAIRFDEAQTVSEVNRYTLKDGRVIDFVDRETPTKGKELSLLQQLLGNVGNVGSLSGMADENQGPSRGN